MRLALALGVCVGLVPVVRGQDLTFTAPAQDRPVYIVGATVHPVSDAPIEDGVVGFEDGRLTYVGPADGFEGADEGALVIEAEGLHVYPGLISPVTRIGLVEVSAVRATRDFDETGGITPEVHAAVSVNPDSTVIPVTRTGGVLVAGVFPSGGRVPGRASVMRMEGWTYEDMTVEASAGLIIDWPNVRPGTEWWRERPTDEQRRRVREALDEIERLFVAAEAYARARASDDGARADLRLGAMVEVLAGADPQKPVFIHAEDVDQITSAVSWATGRGLRPVIVGGRDAALAADLLRRHDVPVIVGGTHRFPKRADSAHDEPFTLPARLEELGVRWCLAGSERDGNVRNLPFEAGRAVAFGLDPDAAIRSITASAAEILGVGDELGALRPGMAATLIITDGNPLEVRTNVRRAFIDGRDIDLSNKQTVLRDKYRERYRQLGLIEDDDDEE